jgi:magnesium transporter
MVMRALALRTPSTAEELDSVSAVRAAHAEKRALWVDLGERSEGISILMRDTFGLHPLVVEDIWLDRSIPKIEAFDGYVYLAVHALTRGSEVTKLELLVVDIVVGPNFVLTHHEGARACGGAPPRLARSPELLEHGPWWIAHAILDAIVDRYLPFAEAMGKCIEGVEQEVVDRAGKREARDMMPQIFALKRASRALARSARDQSGVLESLARGEQASMPKEAVPYFRDVYDHFHRVTDVAETYRDVVIDTLDAYLSVQSNRMNEAVKALTMVSTIILPLSLIASIYGMNFRYMPELGWKYGYPFALGLMVVVALALLAWLKRKGWV